jgi:ABC-type glycerol-3-phosphate transport system substrate-binding protein
MPATIAGGRPVTISIVGKPLDTDPTAVEQWNAQIARFQKLYPNVTIKSSDYQYAPDTFLTLVAGKQVPTLFEVYLTDPGNMISQGIAADITSYFDANNLQSVYNPNILSLTVKDNKVYGIPEFAYGMGLAYNTDLLKQAGIAKPPATWQELAQDAATLTKRDQGQAGFTFINDGTNASGWQYTTMSYSFGAKLQDLIKANSDGSFTATFGKGVPLDTLKYIQDLRWKYDVLPRENMDWAKNGQTFATGQAAMAVMAGDQFAWIRTTYPDVDLSKLKFAPLPAGPDGTATSLVGGNVAMISNAASADEKEAAVYYKLWTTFDVAEHKASLDLIKAKKESAIGTPTLPMYVGSYQDALDAFQKPYNNMPTENYQEFLTAVKSGKVRLQPEPGPNGQDYYAVVGTALSTILTDKTADPAAVLDKAASTLQTNTLSRLKK